MATTTATTVTLTTSNKFKSKFKLNNSMILAAVRFGPITARSGPFGQKQHLPNRSRQSQSQSQSLCCRHESWRINRSRNHSQSRSRSHRPRFIDRNKTKEDSWPVKSNLDLVHNSLSLSLSVGYSHSVSLNRAVVLYRSWHGSWLKWSSLPKSFVLFCYFALICITFC